jgi:serine protease inhibitor
MKRLASILLLVAIMMSLCVPAFAETVVTDVAITREGAAKEAVLLLWHGKTDSEIETELNSYSSENGFSDVTEDEGYIKAAKANGIISGFEDGTFRPKEPITGEQAIKMVVCALGYDAQAKEQGGYPSGYIQVAMEKGLVVDVDANSDDMPIAKDAFLSIIASAKAMLDANKPQEDDSYVAKLMSQMPQDQNYMISPFSIRMAMALAANGADGDTKKEICDALDIGDLGAYNQLAADLIKKYSEKKDVKLDVANSIWLNTDTAGGAKFSDAYQTLIGDFYSGTAQEVTDENAVKTINDWISEKTNGKIKDVLSDSEFLSALVNTIYFKGEWQKQFDEEATKAGAFTQRDGKTVEKQFMNESAYYQYFENDSLQALKLPYKDRTTSMYVVLPREGKQMNCSLKTIKKQMSSGFVEVKLPKFKVEYSQELKSALKTMGIGLAFESQSADLTPMFNELPQGMNPYIGKILHKTYIDVDENGTEAAAATAVIVEGGGVLPQEPKQFTADRPFAYYICDDESGEVLFAGEIVS